MIVVARKLDFWRKFFKGSKFMSKIKKINAYQLLDSRGFPTVGCKLMLDNGRFVAASVPSGASVGQAEALELRDGDPELFAGKSVLKAIDNIENIIAPALIGQSIETKTIDEKLIELDGTENKSKFGANATLAVSIAALRAQALIQDCQPASLINTIYNSGPMQRPQCMFNILNGGMHADNSLFFQEFMIMPQKTTSIMDTLHVSFKVYQSLKKLLHEDKYFTGVGDEGGFAPHFKQTGMEQEKVALSYLMKAIDKANVADADVGICLDVAASYFFDKETNQYCFQGECVSGEQLVSFYEELVREFPIVSIEDGMDEHDHEGWKLLTKRLGSKIMLVGDDLFVTSAKLIEQGVHEGMGNAAIIKPNQRGTVLEAIEAIKRCKENNFSSVVSHRSGETTDDFIADLVVGSCSLYFKAGACARGERVAKYNRLLQLC